MKVSRYFELSEFCTSQTATRYGIAMNPPPAVVENIKALATTCLDPLRAHFGLPCIVSSGYRPPALNSLIRGSARSQHISGMAADFTIPGIPVIEICRVAVKLELPYDQLIYEFGAWVHISHNRQRCRSEVLTASRRGRSVVYTPGLPV